MLGNSHVALNQVSARFFLELAVGLMVCTAFVDLRRVGPGFLRLMALLALGCLTPALLLQHSSMSFWESNLTFVFGALTLVLLAGAGALPDRLIRSVLIGTCALGLVSIVVFVRVQTADLETDRPLGASLLLWRLTRTGQRRSVGHAKARG